VARGRRGGEGQGKGRGGRRRRRRKVYSKQRRRRRRKVYSKARRMDANTGTLACGSVLLHCVG